MAAGQKQSYLTCLFIHCNTSGTGYQERETGRKYETAAQRELADFLDLNLSTITRAFKICENKGLFSVIRLIIFLSLTIHQAHPFIEKPQKNGFKLFK